MAETSQDVAADIAALLRSRNSLLWVITREEARAESYIFESAASSNYVCRAWDCAAGVTGMDGKPERNIGSEDIGQTLTAIRERALSGKERGVWIMRDLAPWLMGPIGMTTVRQVRNLARLLPTIPRDSAQAMIVLTTSTEVPPELAGHATVIEWPLPDRAEITRILDAAIDGLPDDLKEGAAKNGTRDAAIDAAVGLSGEEAAACYARSLVQLRKIDPATVAKEKKRIIARERVLEWIPPISGGLDAVGGLDVLKTWLASRKLAYSASARAYGLPSPKGALLVGISGCGKSLTAKAIATAWDVPLLRLDLNALKSKFVGESEGNLRKALKVIEAIGTCVLWIDEVEKALAGATSGSADGGVSSDALGTVLSWMQERGDGGAFIVATANSVAELPPEFLRRGRFDQIFWIDLPNLFERIEILKVALRSYAREDVAIDYERVADACDAFTGSEIASIVPDALYRSFADGERQITTDDLLHVARAVVPLSTTAQEKIEALRSWAKLRAVAATSILSRDAVLKQQREVRQIDL